MKLKLIVLVSCGIGIVHPFTWEKESVTIPCPSCDDIENVHTLINNLHQRQKVGQGYEVLETSQTLINETDEHQVQVKIDRIFKALERYKSIDVTVVDDKKRTILHNLLRSPYMDNCLLVKIILKKGALLNVVDDTFQTPLDYLVQEGSAWLLKEILKDKSIIDPYKESVSFVRADDTQVSVEEEILPFLNHVPLESTEKIITIFESSDSVLQNTHIMNNLVSFYSSILPSQLSLEESIKFSLDVNGLISAYHGSLKRNEDLRFSGLYTLGHDVAMQLAHNFNLKLFAQHLYQYGEFLKAQNQENQTPAHVFVKNSVLALAYFLEAVDMYKDAGSDFSIRDTIGKTVYDYMYVTLKDSMVHIFNTYLYGESAEDNEEQRVLIFMREHNVTKCEEITEKHAQEYLRMYKPELLEPMFPLSSFIHEQPISELGKK